MEEPTTTTTTNNNNNLSSLDFNCFLHLLFFLDRNSHHGIIIINSSSHNLQRWVQLPFPFGLFFFIFQYLFWYLCMYVCMYDYDYVHCLWNKQTAAVAWGAGEALVMEEVEVSPPQPLEIRIKVVSTSLCRSDLSAWETHVSFLFYHNHYRFNWYTLSMQRFFTVNQS